LLPFFLPYSPPPPHLPSFPTRRSSDLRMDIAAEFMSGIIDAFEANKRLADRAVEQMPDDRLHVALDENTNSIAVIMKHVAGNLTDRKSTRLNSSHVSISYAVFCLKKKK